MGMHYRNVLLGMQALERLRVYRLVLVFLRSVSIPSGRLIHPSLLDFDAEADGRNHGYDLRIIDGKHVNDR